MVRETCGWGRQATDRVVAPGRGHSVNLLSAQGYLPKELPPIFSSRVFASVADELPSGPTGWTKPSVHNLARPGTVRRRLLVPNPFPQHRLNEALTNNWEELNASLDRSALSASRPDLRRHNRDRAATPVVGYSALAGYRLARMRSGPFRLTTDIAKFYGSVYTHSIEWGVDSREAAKDRVARRGTKTTAASLDDLVRDTMDGQTVGIPVGPDSSLVLAELILCACDAELQEAFPGIERYAWRWFDDLEVFTDSVGKAEAVLASWQGILERYELTIAEEKTEIARGPFPLEPTWRSELSTMRLRLEEEEQLANDLVALFSKAFEIRSAQPKAHVLSYAAGITARALKDRELTGRAGTTLFDLMLTSAEAEPSTLPYAYWNLRRIGARALDRDALAAGVHQLLLTHAAKGHDSETAWALFLCHQYRLNLDAEVENRIGQTAGPVALALLAKCVNEGLADASALEVAVAHADEPDVAKSPNWIVALELANLGLHQSAELLADPGFAELVSRGVTFLVADDDPEVYRSHDPRPQSPSPSPLDGGSDEDAVVVDEELEGETGELDLGGYEMASFR
jgi:hypothetical protein